MKNIGILKAIDGMGRIGIPKELRRQYNFNKEIEIVLLAEGILIRNPNYVLVEKSSLCNEALAKKGE